MTKSRVLDTVVNAFTNRSRCCFECTFVDCIVTRFLLKRRLGFHTSDDIRVVQITDIDRRLECRNVHRSDIAQRVKQRSFHVQCVVKFTKLDIVQITCTFVLDVGDVHVLFMTHNIGHAASETLSRPYVQESAVHLEQINKVSQ